MRVERGAVGKEAVEGRDELRGGDVDRAVAVERPDEEGGLVDGLRGRVERVKSGRTRRTRPTTVCVVGRRGCRDGADDAEDVRPAVERAGEAEVEREGREERGLGDCRPGRVAETPAKARRRLTAPSVTSRGLRARSGAMRAKPRVAHMSSWSAAEWRTQWKTKSSAPATVSDVFATSRTPSIAAAAAVPVDERRGRERDDPAGDSGSSWRSADEQRTRPGA